MANTYTPSSLGINANTTGGVFQEGAWYGGRQYIGGTLSDPGVIHPGSSQIGSGQLVSEEVNRQSDQAQGNQPGDIEKYLANQRTSQPSTAKAIPMNTGNVPRSMASGSGSGASLGVPDGEQFNLPELYKSLTEDSGIKAIQDDLFEKEKAFTEAKGKINDNPYLSEATRVGRISKMEKLHAERTADARGQIATKKADIETQLNLQTKQFDINSQMASDALERLNFMLESGALAGATGEDIATLTRTSGISSSMIYSAIDANKAKNTQTEMIKWDDGTNQGFSIVNASTGEVISSSTVARSDPGSGGGGSTGTSVSSVQKRVVSDSQQLEGFNDDSGKWWGIFPQLVAVYATQLSLPEIYRAYASAGNPSPEETAEEIQAIYDEARGE